MRFYRALLHLYPKSFRHEYGHDLAAIFAERLRRSSAVAAVALWLRTIADVVANAAAVHADILRQDLRYTTRSLRRSKGFAATAIVVVGVGIGATTAVFSVADFMLLRPLPFPQADRLVKVWERHPGYPQMELSPANYRDFRKAAGVFSSFAAYTNLASANLTGKGEPRRLLGSEVTANFLPTLGVDPLIGRRFTEADDREGAAGTILLSYRLWQTDFGGRPEVVGGTIHLDQQPYTIVGIMPATFHYPDDETQYWVPLRAPDGWYEDRNNNFLYGLARLNDGVTLAQARAAMDVVAAQLQRQYPKDNAHTGAWVNAIRDELPWQSTMLLMALGAASMCVLLIACANLASLLLTRALGRRTELAVRAAIGAGRERLARQLMTESVVLAIAGGALGVLIGAAAVPLLTQLVPPSLPLAEAPRVDLRVMAFAGVLTLLTAVAFGMFPMLRLGRRDGLEALRETARSGGRGERLRGGLVVAEIVASIVLLVSAGLLLRALWRVQAIDPGFRVEGVLAVRTPLPSPRYDEDSKRRNFYTAVLDQVRALPGVRAAAYTSYAPMTFGGGIFPVSTDGAQHEDRSAGYSASLRKVTPGFFATLGVPLVEGRDIADTDTRDRPAAAVVSRSFVKRFLADGADPIGRHFQFAFQDVTVVGVVGDVHVRGLEQPSEPQVYLSYLQKPDWAFYWPKDLLVRSSVASDALVPSIRAIVRKMDAEQPIASVKSMTGIVEARTASRQAQLNVLVTFAAIAFLLAAIGIHGVLSFAVSQRTREIGVRMALGAQRGDILAWVARRALLLSALGSVLGLALAYIAGRLLESLLAGVAPADAPTFAAAVALAVLMTLAGALAPSLRAVHVDPIRVIRQD
jgi:putative ABC transport system permease protein